MKKNDEYSAKEAAERRDAVLRAMIGRPPEHHETLNAQKKKRPPKSGASPKAKGPSGRG